MFGELPDAWTWLGGAIIVAATVYIAQREAQDLAARTRGGAAGALRRSCAATPRCRAPPGRAEVGRLDVGADGLQRQHQHRRVIGEADAGQDVRDHVGRHDEVGECCEQHRLGIGRRRRIDGGIVGGNGLVDERHPAQGTADLLPEPALDVAFLPGNRHQRRRSLLDLHRLHCLSPASCSPARRGSRPASAIELRRSRGRRKGGRRPARGGRCLDKPGSGR